MTNHIFPSASSPIHSRTLLGFDTTAGAVSSALWQNGKIIAESCEMMSHGHDRRLLPQIAALMKRVDVQPIDLDAIIVAAGPGSFTGIRVGLATAEGLSFALNIPAIGVDLFAVYAAKIYDSEMNDIDIDALLDATIMVVIDSRRAELFTQCYKIAMQGLVRDGPPRLLCCQQINDILTNVPCSYVTGNAVALLDELPPNCQATPIAQISLHHLVAVGVENWLKNGQTEGLKPVYLREAEATPNKIVNLSRPIVI